MVYLVGAGQRDVASSWCALQRYDFRNALLAYFFGGN